VWLTLDEAEEDDDVDEAEAVSEAIIADELAELIVCK